MSSRVRWAIDSHISCYKLVFTSLPRNQLYSIKSLSATTTEAPMPRAYAPQQEKLQQ